MKFENKTGDVRVNK